ncbi:response regulator, partial [Erysipelatoclostridium ramosum]
VREHKAVPILIMSARKDRNDQLNGYELGADDYIEKPVDPQILAAKIRAVLQRNSDLHRKETISCCGVVIARAQHRA